MNIMKSSMPKYLFSQCQQPNQYHPDVSSIVLFGVTCDDGEVVYLEIRYIDYDRNLVEGDHLWLSLEEALHYSYVDFGISEGEWKALSSDEILRIDLNIN